MRGPGRGAGTPDARPALKSSHTYVSKYVGLYQTIHADHTISHTIPYHYITLHYMTCIFIYASRDSFRLDLLFLELSVMPRKGRAVCHHGGAALTNKQGKGSRLCEIHCGTSCASCRGPGSWVLIFGIFADRVSRDWISIEQLMNVQLVSCCPTWLAQPGLTEP